MKARKILRAAAIGAGALVLVAVVALVVLSRKGAAALRAPDTPLPSIVASKEPAIIARGEYLVRTVGHCTQCHGAQPLREPDENTPDVALSGGMEFVMGPLGTLYGANLTPDRETGLGRRSDGEVARAIATGVLPDGRISIFMRFAGNLSENDLTAVVSYLRSLEPVRNAVPAGELSTLGNAFLAFVEIGPDQSSLPAHVEPGDAPSVERGAYLADQVSLCVACHTTIDMSTFLPTGPKAGGGSPDPSPADDGMEFIPPNLTSHPTGVTGKLDEDAFVARLRKGRVYVPSKMPWENLSRMTEADMRSIYRFLRSLPPVDNDVGPTLREKGWQRASHRASSP